MNVLNQKAIIIQDSRQINLSSNSASIKLNGDYNSSLFFQLPSLYVKDNKTQYAKISIVHAEIPVSYYVVNINNNILYINSIKYSLTVGNYTTTTFITMLLTIIPSGFSCTFSSLIRKYTLTYTSNFTINSGSTCYNLMGFNNLTSYTSTSFSLLMPNVADFSGIKRVNICSNLLKCFNYDSITGQNSNLLASIAVNSSAGGIIYFLNQSNFSCLVNNNSIDYLDIQITDEYNNLINFNNCNVFLTLQIDIYREILIYDNNLLQILN